MEGRVIKSEDVPIEGSCRVLCYMEPNCVSINVGPSREGNTNTSWTTPLQKTYSISNLYIETGPPHGHRGKPSRTASTTNNTTIKRLQEHITSYAHCVWYFIVPSMGS